MGPIRMPELHAEAGTRDSTSSRKTSAALDRDYWTPRRRLLAAFLFGALIILAGIFFALRDGLSFVTIWYLGIGALLMALAIGGLLGLVRVPIRTREDALVVLARPSTLAITLLIGSLLSSVATTLYEKPWPESVLRFLVLASFVLLLFAYARRWTNRHPTDPSAKTM